MTGPWLSRRQALAAFGVGLTGVQAQAQAATEIVFGQTFDGRSAELALLARVQQAMVAEWNRRGGARGRSIRLLSLDDQGSAVQAIANVRQLVERDHALALFGMPFVGGLSETVPQLFVTDGVAVPAPPAGAPAVRLLPTPAVEGAIVARHLMEQGRAVRVVFVQGTEPAAAQWAAGWRAVGAAQAGVQGAVQARVQEVRSVTPSTGAPFAPAEVAGWLSGGVDVVILNLAPRAAWAAAEALLRLAPQTTCWLSSAAAGMARALPPERRRGLRGVCSVRYFKDGRDPQWARRQPFEFQEYPRWARDAAVWPLVTLQSRHLPGVDIRDEPVLLGSSTVQLLEQVLGRCRDQVTSDNLLRQAQRLGGADAPLLTPGVRALQYPGRPSVVSQGQPVRFDGTAWEAFADVVDAELP